MVDLLNIVVLIQRIEKSKDFGDIQIACHFFCGIIVRSNEQLNPASTNASRMA